jgi:hypothetical protein
MAASSTMNSNMLQVRTALCKIPISALRLIFIFCLLLNLGCTAASKVSQIPILRLKGAEKMEKPQLIAEGFRTMDFLLLEVRAPNLDKNSDDREVVTAYFQTLKRTLQEKNIHFTPPTWISPVGSVFFKGVDDGKERHWDASLVSSQVYYPGNYAAVHLYIVALTPKNERGQIWKDSDASNYFSYDWPVFFEPFIAAAKEAEVDLKKQGMNVEVRYPKQPPLDG